MRLVEGGTGKQNSGRSARPFYLGDQNVNEILLPSKKNMYLFK